MGFTKGLHQLYIYIYIYGVNGIGSLKRVSEPGDYMQEYTREYIYIYIYISSGDTRNIYIYICISTFQHSS